MDTDLLIRVLLERARLRRRDRWDRARLAAHQARALRDLRAFAYARSSFYRRFHAGLTAAPLEDLPVLTKQRLMDVFDDVVTRPGLRLADVQRHMEHMKAGEPFRGRYVVAGTSGTTGRPGIFIWDRSEWATVLASYARANDWAAVPASFFRPLRLAVVSSRMPRHQSAAVGTTLSSRWLPTLRLDAAQPLPQIVESLNAFRPQSLVAYASVARILAEEQIAGALRIAPLAVFSASEVLTAEGAERIERAWGKRPFNVYAATETAGIASECDRHQGLHLYEDLVVTEIVDESGQPTPAGVAGARILVTALFNRTQPLIRYEISDRLTLSARPCPCGRPFALVAGIEGRAEEVLSFRAVAGAPVRVHPVLFHRLLDPQPVASWQVVQEPGRLRVLVTAPQSPFDPRRLGGDVARALADTGAAAPPVEVEIVSLIPRGAAGKSPLIRVAHPDGAPRRYPAEHSWPTDTAGEEKST